MSRAELNKRSCQLRSIVEHLDSIFSAMKPKQSINDDSSHAYTDTHILSTYFVYRFDDLYFIEKNTVFSILINLA